MNAFWNIYREYRSVPSSGPPSPFVIIYAGVNVIKAEIVCITRLKNIIGLNSGKVILKKT